MSMKYIIISTDHDEKPVLFDSTLPHKAIADGIGARVVSAGRVKVFEFKGKVAVSAIGESKSLGLKARTEDSHLIQKRMTGEL
jgi:hypothetical protein